MLRKTLGLLLGTVVSIGLLASPARAVNDGITVQGVLTNEETNTPFANSKVIVIVIEKNDSCGGVDYLQNIENVRTDKNGKFTAVVQNFLDKTPVPSDCILQVFANTDEAGYFSPSNEAVQKAGPFRYGDTLNFEIPIRAGEDPDAIAARESEAAATSETVDSTTGTDSNNLLGTLGGALGVILIAALAIGYIWFFFWFVPRAAAKIAARRGRRFWLWFWITFFFTIPGIVLVNVLKAIKTCPHCGEKIRQSATKCKYCGEAQEVTASTTPSQS